MSSDRQLWVAGAELLTEPTGELLGEHAVGSTLLLPINLTHADGTAEAADTGAVMLGREKVER